MRKLAVLFALALLPLAAARAQPFCPGVAPWVFADVQASDSFCTYITWMAVTGVTTGCQVIDANNRLYCPDDLVTRKQMSAFMSRLGRDVAFAEGGNAFGTLPNNTAVLGTADGNALDVRVNNSRVMRYEPNSISPNVIGGSPANNVTAGVRGATIAGGGVPAGDTDPDLTDEAPNRVTDAYGTVGGGYGNRAGDNTGTTVDRPFATVGGGNDNTASGIQSTVGGGEGNAASGERSTVGGGYGNESSGDFSTVGGGHQSGAYGYSSTVGGGFENTASGNHSTVGGGINNTASGAWSTVAGGNQNVASGVLSTIPGGESNLALGDNSFAAGARARATHHNTFVWGGSSTIDTNSIADGDFVVYAPTAIRMFAGAPGSGGCTLTSGAGWACASDRTLKSDVAPVDGAAVLEQLAALPIARWSFTSVPGTAHMGPMAQDFHAAFKLGDDATRLAPMDVQGVALAAIQGLNAKLESVVADKDAEIAALKERLAKVETSHARDMADLRLAVEVLMARTSTDGRVAQTR